MNMDLILDMELLLIFLDVIMVLQLGNRIISCFKKCMLKYLRGHDVCKLLSNCTEKHTFVDIFIYKATMAEF